MGHEDLNFKIMHVGVNCENEQSALQSADFFNSYFNIEKYLGKDSIYVGPTIELMKGQGLGVHGHIAVGTDDIYKSKEYLESLGLEFLNNSIKYDADGEMIVIYLKQEVAGFAIHLLQNKLQKEEII